MAEEINSDIHCDVHDKEVLNLYCCDCEEIICLQCLIGDHQRHEMKSLSVVHERVQERLFHHIKSEKDKTKERLFEAKNAISNVKDLCGKEKILLCTQADQHGESLKKEIDNAVKNNKERLHSAFETYKVSIEALDKDISCSEKMLEDESFGCNPMKSVEAFISLKRSLATNKKLAAIAKEYKPIYRIYEEERPEILLGMVVTGKSETNIKQTEETNRKISREIQTEGISLPHNVKRSAAQNTMAESSSDELREGEYPKVLEMTSGVKLTKLVPISDDIAWVINNGKLMKLTGTLLEPSIFDETVNDFSILKDGSLLLLQREQCYIKRMLCDRIINFVHSGNRIPQCIFTKPDNHSVVFFNLNSSAKCANRIINEFDEVGVVLKTTEITFDRNCVPVIMTMIPSNQDIFMLFKDICYGYHPPRSRVVKFKGNTDEAEFRGSIGILYYENFICDGLCNNNKDSLLVADQKHQAVLLVDSNMKYIKCILLGVDGLEAPSLVAYFKGIIWVVDGNKIRKFKCE